MEDDRGYSEDAAEAQTCLDRFGITITLQQRIGAFGVCWGLFESTLETATWNLLGESVKGVRPSTDKTSLETWLKWFSQEQPNMSVAVGRVLEKTAAAARDLAAYRNSIFHGELVPGKEPSFIRNSGWHGEERNRERHSSYVTEQLLDKAVAAAWVLYKAADLARAMPFSPQSVQKLEALECAVDIAKEHASQLRASAYQWNV